MTDFQISEQDYLELQETVLSYAQVKDLDEDYVLLQVDSFLTEPNSKNSLLIWEALVEDDLGLVKNNPQLQELINIASKHFKQSENSPTFH